MGKVDLSLSVIDPNQEGKLYKFVKTRITGQPRTAFTHKNLDNWLDLKNVLKETPIWRKGRSIFQRATCVNLDKEKTKNYNFEYKDFRQLDHYFVKRHC